MKQSKQPQTNTSKTFIWIAGLSTLAAIFIHIYLLNQHFELKFGVSAGKSACDINATFNCTAVAASQYSEFLGVPIALWGIAANVVLLLLLLISPFFQPEGQSLDTGRAIVRRNLLMVSGAIAIASVVMGGISAFALSQFCLFCIAAYVLSFIGFGSLWKGLDSSTTTKINIPLTLGSKPVAVLGLIAIAFSFIAKDQLAKSYSGSPSGASGFERLVNSSVQEWKNSPAREIKTIDPLAIGADSVNAKMTIVEFADFRCIHCKHAAPTLKAFVNSRPDVRLEFQPWPLDGECNTAISQPNGASCLLARITWCAEQKTKRGWDAHNFIFDQETYMSTTAIENDIEKLATATGMDAEALRSCSNSEEAKEAIRKIAAVGTALNLQGTPAIFVNGKQLPAGQSLPVLTEAYNTLKKN